MRLSPFKILMIFVVFTIWGLFMIPRLPVRLNPGKMSPVVNVNYYWQGAGSYNMEKLVTSPLEAAFATLKGIKKITSKSSKNYGYITLEADRYTDLDVLRFEIATIIRRIYNKLPQGVSYPAISINKPGEEDSNLPVVSYSVAAPYPSSKILSIVESKILPAISSVKGVDKINIFGATKKEWQISYNKTMLDAAGISKRELIDAIQRYFAKINLGAIKIKDEYTLVSIYPPVDTLSWKIPVKKTGGRIIYLDQITNISLKEQKPRFYYRVNAKNATGFTITAATNTNTIELVSSIQKKLDGLKKELDRDVEIFKIYDSTVYLKSELNKIYKRSFYTVLILLVFVLLVSFSFRYLLVLVSALIVNISIAFLLYKLAGIELHLYSLAGITISLGLIIDNIIVMTDHIISLKNRKVFIPLLASTLTTLGALSVIFFLDEKLKLSLVDFALVMVINLTVSLFVALFFVPAMIEKTGLRSLKKRKILPAKALFKLYAAMVIKIQKYRKSVIAAGILAFGIPLFLMPGKIENPRYFYEKLYNKTFGNTWYLKKVKPYTDKIFGGTLRLFTEYVSENSYFGSKEQTKLYLNASMEKGATIDQMNEAILQIENFLLQFEGIDKFVTYVYSGDNANIEITFKKKYEKGILPVVLKSKLISKAMEQGGIKWNIFGVGESFFNKSNPMMNYDFRIQGRGYDYDKLKVWADTLKEMLKEHPRVREVVIRDNSLWRRRLPDQYRLILDKERLTLKDNSPLQIHKDIKELTLNNSPDINLFLQGEYLPLRFISEESRNFDLWYMKNILTGNKQSPVKLKNTSRIVKEPEEENIFKENQEYLIKVEYRYTGARKFGKKHLKKVLQRINEKLPLGFKFEPAKTGLWNKKDKKRYVMLLLLIAVIIIFICSVLFENIKQALIIIAVIPVSYIGLFLTFYHFDIGFDQGGIAAFILLSGITVNSSIYILDQYNAFKKRHPGFDSSRIFLLAFKYKIYPVILTIVSTILGFIPFLIIGGKDTFWYSLAAGTIGGLVFSFIAISIFLPALVLSGNKRGKLDLPRGSRTNNN